MVVLQQSTESLGHHDITAAVVKNTGAPAEATEVIIHDVPRTNWAVAGKLASES